MDKKYLTPEYAPPPREYAPRPELEYTAPPPEFDRRTLPEEPETGKKRRLRQILAVPAILLLGFLCLHAWNPTPTPAIPEAHRPGPGEPGTTTSVSTEPGSTEPSETAVPEVPQDSVILDGIYALREGDSVRYSYTVYTPVPSIDATQAQFDAYRGPIWPVEVYARVTDSQGNSAGPETPDVWEGSRAAFDYVLEAPGLEGDLTLTLTALYEEAGETRQSQTELPVAEEPTLSGSLEAAPGGQVEAGFRLIPAPGDAHPYQLRVIHAGQEVLDGEEVMGLSLVNDFSALPITGSNEEGFTILYSGGSAAASIPTGTQLRLYVVLVDEATGREYTINTNPVDPVEPISAYETYPLGDGMLVFTVYNDTLTFDVPSAVEMEDDYRSFLAVDSLEEAGFTGYELPDPVNPGGFTFGGWVIHVNNPMDLGSENDAFMQYNGDPPVEALVTEDSFAFPVGNTITVEDVERVPATQVEGRSVRFINVHPVWLRETADADFYLDDGLGNVTGYSQDSPMYSEGFLYLCGYPVPDRPGYVFDGWYDEAGNRVDLLVSYFSFTPAIRDEAGNFQGYDWNGEQEPFTLYARWRPE